MINVVSHDELPFGLLNSSVLNVLKHVQHSLGEWSGVILFVDRHGVLLLLVRKLANRRHSCCSSCAECFVKTSFFDCSYHFLDFKFSLRNLKLLQTLCQRQNRVTSNTWQYGSVERGSDEFIDSIFVLPEDEEVHSSYLSYVVVQEPKNLITIVFHVSLSTDSQSGCVVSTDFLVAETIWPSSDDTGVAIQSDWNEASGVVWSNRTEHDKCLHLLNFSKAESVVHAD